jgi:hypothetical protein
LSLIAISTVVDYVIGRRMPTTTGSPKTALLVTSMVVNLGILGTFKYAGFFLRTARAVADRAGRGASVWQRRAVWVWAGVTALAARGSVGV